MTEIVRLSAADVMNLAVEAPDTPMHQAVLALVDAAPLRRPDGRLDVYRLREHVESRLDRTPELRRVVCRPGLFQGRALLVDSPRFRIEDHVLVATLPAPGGEAAALAFAEAQMATPMDRMKPMWEIWLLDGYSPERVALLIKLHHAIADGSAMVNLLAQILDLEPAATERRAAAWVPAAAPTAGELLSDNVSSKLRAVARPVKAMAHPVRRLVGFADSLRAIDEELRQARGGAQTSINQPVQVGRRLTAVHLSLDEAKLRAHRLGVKLNDLFLYVVVRSLRDVLVRRGEEVHGASLHLSVAVSQPEVRGIAASGNHAGTVIVPVPIDFDDPREQLAAVAAAAAHAKAEQHPVVSTNTMSILGRTRVARAFTRRQHMLNVLTTNLPGPPVPLYFAGARVESPVALPPIAGNVTVSFAALSYASELAFSVVADATAWPDFDALKSTLAESWRELQELSVSDQGPTITSSPMRAHA